MIKNKGRFKKERYSLEDLLDIMAVLRSPDGCPWDREQTHDSIRQNFIEETYEVCDAIDQRDKPAICEELGDVLLQVVFHSCMAEESGDFAFGDVVTGICKKLIHRHPHIFGDVVAETSSEVLQNWDAIKKAEKGQKSYHKAMQDVPRALPALIRANKIQQRAAKSGFDWSDANEAFYKISEETDELKEAMSRGVQDDIINEMGDVLFSAVNVSRLLGIDPEQALERTADRFMARFEIVERLAAERSVDMQKAALSELDLLWDEAKREMK